MRTKFAHKLEEWLLPRGRTLLLGLLVANAGVALFLIAGRGPTVEAGTAPAVAAELEPKIQLLAEAGPAPAIEQPPARECRLWGPEQSPDAFENLVAELSASGSFPEIESRQVKAASDYLVFIGELGSRDNAKRIAKELDALDIDSYLINPKDQPLMLSVGVFSRQALALKQRERMAELGYAVAIKELERAQTVYQLSAHVHTDSVLYKSSTSACVAIAHNT